MLSVHRVFFIISMLLISVKVAWSIVNSPPDKAVHEIQESLTPSSIFNRFKKHHYGSREFKKGSSGQISVWGSSSLLDPQSINNFIANPANIHNLVQTANDHVDMSGVSSDVPLGAANGYVFQKPSKVSQGFKNFGIRFGKYGHLYGTGAFFSQRDYPYESR